MAGRKPLVAPSEVVAAVMHFKERVVTKNNDGISSKYFLSTTNLLLFMKKIVIYVGTNQWRSVGGSLIYTAYTLKLVINL